MEQELFVIRTTLNKNDFREYLYISTFLRNKKVFAILYGVCVILAIISNWILHNLTVQSVIVRSLIVFGILVVLLCAGIEVKSRRFAKNTGIDENGENSILRFYKDHMEVGIKASGDISYDQFYELLESKKYYLFYFNEKFASFVKKSEVQNEEDFSKFLKDVFGDKYRKI